MIRLKLFFIIFLHLILLIAKVDGRVLSNSAGINLHMPMSL